MLNNKLLIKIKFHLILFGGLLLSLLAFNANAAALPNSNYESSTFDCKTLYGSTQYFVYSINTTTGEPARMYQSTIDTSTLALGRPGGDSSSNPLNMYFWATSNTRTIHSVVSDATESNVIGTFNSTISNWAGGEVNQITGRIYLSSASGALLQGTTTANAYRIASVNPQDVSDTIRSDTLLPAEGQTALTGVVSSDMAIDAEGNIYTIVGNSTSRTLIRIKPAETGNWRYNAVATITGVSGTVWGMAFVGGKLYAVTDSRNFYEINVLTGVATSRPFPGASLSGNPQIRDLTSCQVAPVIRGKIYHDTTGTGQITGDEAGLSGIQVLIWKDGVLQKTYTTDSSGEYSFIVDSTENQDYYISIKQPTINDVNALQTWAGADSSSVNPVIAYCRTSDGTTNQLTADGVCRGANRFDVGTSPSNSYIYSKITMNSDRKVAEADFALTTVSNYGDAPSSYNNSGTLPARHLAPGAGSSIDDKLNWLRLGDLVTIQSGMQASEDASSISSHDGVKVAIKGSTDFISLQDAFLVSGETYTFQVKTTGPASGKGYLNGWIDWSASTKVAGSFGTTQIAKDVAGVANGYVTFEYTVPVGSATGLHPTYARFRFSTTAGLGPNNDVVPTPSATVPWAIDGEVEDYRLYIKTGDVQIATISKGGTGQFNYAMTNIISWSPSSDSDSLKTVANDFKVTSSSLHSFAQVGSDITITQTLPTTDWEIIEAVCTLGSSTIDTTLSNNVLTIPASAVKEGANIACTFTNGVTPKIELAKAISGTRFNSNDQFTVQIKEGDTVTTSTTTSGTATTATTSATKVKGTNTLYTLSEEMTNGSISALARYNAVLSCLNSYSESTTVLPSGAGQSFDLTPNYGDNIACTLTNTSITADSNSSIIKADPTSITANGTTESIITVQLKDANGNNFTIGGDNVEIFFTDTANKIGLINGSTDNSVIATDNNDGTYTVKVTSIKTGSDTFSYKVNNVTAPSNKIVTVIYTVDSASASTSEISLSPQSIVANNADLSIVTVTLKDSQGNKLLSGKDPKTDLDYTVKLIVDTTTDTQTGILQPTDGTMTNNGDGTFTAYVKSTKVGDDVLGFTINGLTATNQKTVTYTVGEPDATSSVISTDKNSITADGTTISTVTVTLKDKYGNALTTGTDPSTSESYKVVIVITNDPVISDAPLSTVDNGDGTFSAQVTSTKTGTDTFSFTLNGVQSSASPVQVNYVPGIADLTKSTIIAIPTSIVANGVDTSTITVQLKDKYENNLTTQAGNVVITGVNIATQASDEIGASYSGNGQYTVLLSSTKTGTDSDIGFKLNATVGQGTASVTYLAGKADLDQSLISIDKESIIANDSDIATITIQLKDSNGNDLTSSGGVVALVFNNSNEMTGELVQNIVDNNNGTYTATIKSKVIGRDVIGYTLDAKKATNTDMIMYLPGKVDLNQSTIVALPTTIEADNKDSSTITVQLKDAYGNNLSTNEGVITLSTVADSIGIYDTILTYQGGGQYTGQTQSMKTGTDTFEYTLTDVGKGLQTAAVTYKVGGVSLTKSTITVDPISIVADGVVTSKVKVQLKDQNENNLTEQDGNLVYLVDLNTGYPATNKTNFELTYVSNGLYEGTITSITTGFDNIGFKVGASESAALTASDHVTVNYTVGAVDYSTSTIIAEPQSIVANDTAKSIITVQLKDKNGNNITTDQGDMILTGLNVGIPNNSDYSLTFQTNGTYTATVTSTQAATDSAIGFTLANKAGDKTTSITYTPGSINLIQSTITSSLSSITANYSDVSIITVQLKDAYGNNSEDQATGTVQLTGVSVGQIKTPLSYAGQGAYQAEIYSKVTGTDNIGFTIDGSAGGNPANSSDKTQVTYLPGAASLAESTLSVDPDVIVANNATTAKLTVQLKDQFGNNITTSIDDPVAISIVTTTAIGTLSATQDNNDGTYSATVKSSQIGMDDFGFTIASVSSNNEQKVTFIAGSADVSKSTISASPESITADNVTTSTVTVQLKDEYGNNLTSSIGNGVSINFKDTANHNGVINSAVTDNNDGTYSITVLSKVTGSDTFIFSILGTPSTNSTDVTYTPGAASLSMSSISAFPQSIIADTEDTTTITVQLKDQFGNNLTTDVGTVVLTDVSVATQGNITLTYNGGTSGSYSGVLSSTIAGNDATIGYTLAGSTGSDTTSVTYKSGGVSLTQSTITVSPTSIIADNTETSTITVQLSDRYGNPIYDQEVVALTGIDKGTLVNFAYVAGGKYVGTIKSTQIGDDIIGFTVDDESAVDKKTVTYTAGEASLSNSTLNVSPANIVADNMTSSTITVQLFDENGNKLTSSSAKTVLISIEGTPIGTLSATQGTYSATVTSSEIGVDTFVFSLDGNIANSKKTVTYTTGVLSLIKSTITADPESINADGTTTSTITVQLKDQYGNNLETNPGAVTLLNLKTGNITTAIVYVENGRYEGKIISTKSGDDTIGFAIAGYGNGYDTQLVTYTPGTVSLKESTIIVSKPAIDADGIQESIVTVQLKDAYGNNLTTNEGTVALTGLNNGTLSVAMHYVGNGQYQGTVISTKSGTDSVISFSLENKGESDNSTSIMYNAGDVDLTKSIITATPDSIVADDVTTSTIRVQLRDSNGNNLSKKPGEVYVSGINIGTISNIKLSYEGAGIYTGLLTSSQLGSDTIGFNLDGAVATGPNSTANVTYTVGAMDIFVSTIDVDPSTIEADGSTTAKIVIQLKDKYGNNLDSDTGTVALTGMSVGTASTVTYIGNGAYVATVTSTVTGTDTISYTFTDSDTGTVSTSAKTQTVMYIAGNVDPTTSSITLDKESITADGTTKSTITVTLRDANSNLVTSTTNKVQLLQSGSNVGSVVEVTPTGNGMYMFTVTSTITGTDDFTYQFDQGNGWESGDGNVSVTYTAGAVDTSTSTIEVDKSLIPSNGSDVSTISVTLRDVNNNLVTGTDNSVQLVQSGDSFGTITAVKATGDGIFKFNITSVKPGKDTFSYEYNVNQSGFNAGVGSVDITYQVPLDFADNSTIEGVPTSINADGVSQSIVTVKLYQATDDSIALTGLNSTQLTLTIMGDGKQIGEFTPASTFETSPGEYKFIVKSSQLGSDNWTFKTSSKVSSKSVLIEYVTGGEFDQSTSTIVASPTEIDADGKTTSTVTVTMYYATDPSKPLAGYKGLTLVNADGTDFTGKVVALGEPSTGVYTFSVTSDTIGSDTILL